MRNADDPGLDSRTVDGLPLLFDDKDDGFFPLGALDDRSWALFYWWCELSVPICYEDQPVDRVACDRVERLIRLHIHALAHAARTIPRLEQAVATLTKERDEARAQLQAIGRKAFWASKDQPKPPTR